MARIDIYRLIQRESDIAAIERPIRRRVERGQGRLRQARHELLDPANPHRSRGRVSRAGAVPEVQICAQAISRQRSWSGRRERAQSPMA